MIEIKLREMAEKHGIKTAYQLQTLLNIQPSLAAKWFRNDIKMISFESLNMLCKYFGCGITDILIYTLDKDARKCVRETGASMTARRELDKTREIRKRVKEFTAAQFDEIKESDTKSKKKVGRATKDSNTGINNVENEGVIIDSGTNFDTPIKNPQTDSILLNHSLSDTVQSKDTKFDDTKSKNIKSSDAQSDNTTQSGFYNDIYFVNNTGKTILQLLDEAKVKVRQEIEEQYAEEVRRLPNLYKDNPDSLDKFMKGSLKKPLTTRVWDVGYDEQNKKRLRKRLVNIDGRDWLADEDLVALDPDEQVRDYDKDEIVRLGDLQVYKSARRKFGLPQVPASDASDNEPLKSTVQEKTAKTNPPALPDGDTWITTEEIAERLGLSKKSVTDYINKGILPSWQAMERTPHFVKESDYPAFEAYYRKLTGKSKP
jgi:transcriptional regulator with XRE-family HTH domain